MDTPNTVTLAGVIGGAIGALGSFVIKLLTTTHTQRKEIQQGTIQEYKELTDRLEKTLDQTNEEVRRLQKRVEELERDKGRCAELYARAVERIEYFQDLLVGAGIKFRPWANQDSAHNMDIPKGV